jgi:hypothetical protein
VIDSRKAGGILKKGGSCWPPGWLWQRRGCDMNIILIYQDVRYLKSMSCVSLSVTLWGYRRSRHNSVYRRILPGGLGLRLLPQILLYGSNCLLGQDRPIRTLNVSRRECSFYRVEDPVVRHDHTRVDRTYVGHSRRLLSPYGL